MPGEVDRARVDQRVPVERRRCQPDEEAQQLLLLGLAFQAEVLLEAHLARDEVDHRRAEPERGGGHGRDAQFVTGGKHRPTCIDGEEIQPVQVEVDVAQELVVVPRVDAAVEDLEIERWVDRQRHLGQYLDLLAAQVGHRGAGLAVQVGLFEGVEVGEVEGPDPEAGERQEVCATHPAEAGDRHPLVAQDQLLDLREPADVAGEGRLVAEIGWHW